MPDLIEITLPAEAEALSAELEQCLTPYADVIRQSPAILGLETIKLVVEIGALTSGAVVGATVGITQVIKNLLDIQEKLKQTRQLDRVMIGVPGQPPVALETVDELLLRQLLGVDAA